MKFNNANVDDLRRAKRVINRLKLNEMTILYPRLSNSLKIIMYSDASFANLEIWLEYPVVEVMLFF